MTEKQKYLIQTGTGTVWQWNEFLAARPDMQPYDEELLGTPTKEGRSPFLEKRAEEEKAAAKEAKEEKEEKAAASKGKSRE
jgi:hypothetical protein